MRARTLCTALVTCCVTLAAPTPASACWDGFSASDGRVQVNVAGETDWSPGRVRDVASWLARIDALLPAGTAVEAGTYGEEGAHGDASVCGASRADGTCHREIASFAWNGKMESLFGRVARVVHASPETVHRARARRARVWTVQVFAAHDEASAGSVAEQLNERQKRGDGFSCDEGFISVGGFPSWNDCAHVVDGVARDGTPVNRVVVGAFLDPGAARKALAEIGAHTPLRGFVREL
jgi:hypothetical protein